jgi:hypothetical protein
MIISIELSDADWRMVCEALEARALGAESDMRASVEEEDTLEYCIEALADCERIDGYITTIVGNAMERARPKFSEN